MNEYDLSLHASCKQNMRTWIAICMICTCLGLSTCIHAHCRCLTLALLSGLAAQEARARPQPQGTCVDLHAYMSMLTKFNPGGWG